MLTAREMDETFLVEESRKDSRSLIMPHQKEAVKAMTRYFQPVKDIPGRNGILVMPTGSGKTFTAVYWLLSKGVANGYRIVWLVHRQELIEQAYREFRKQTPLLQHTGIEKLKVIPVSAVHKPMSAAVRGDVYICGIQSAASDSGYRFLSRMIGAQGKRRLIIVVDEAHHAVSPSYQKVINRMTKLNPNRILLGLTATPVRMQDREQALLQKMFNIDYNLTHHKGMNGYIYEVTLKQLIESGFLAQPVREPVNTRIRGDVEYDITPEEMQYYATLNHFVCDRFS